MVNLILVSHSEKLADGLKELLAEMAADVEIHNAAGLEGGKIGTDVSRIEEAFSSVTDDAIILTDIGSATMNAEMALELYTGDRTIQFVDVPLVEGAFLAAVQSGQGQSVEEIVKALEGEFSK
ncbi:PTS-dependent dihydroxyacetone kinase phosphotransferase subunit DhaM [Fictibacillus sp. KIGAM418]|uniref:phosphoenolpyruvate--glycerone phosphotransferase n=1 Tax=Fictibacillus marinisediminis TaxID=2878389 RepID=A0A9X1XJG7_9BACL|nr:dihydroxyacetone kinase phosphoryl donor subunit DhaM [Fictibacillus marinisediminis]MCK6258659.1 PTS-dependent dihydroxyacetone kinase phosphotransferase subunit DhaM [Fictibacillus marinisediminis]